MKAQSGILIEMDELNHIEKRLESYDKRFDSMERALREIPGQIQRAMQTVVETVGGRRASDSNNSVKQKDETAKALHQLIEHLKVSAGEDKGAKLVNLLVGVLGILFTVLFTVIFSGISDNSQAIEKHADKGWHPKAAETVPVLMSDVEGLKKDQDTTEYRRYFTAQNKGDILPKIQEQLKNQIREFNEFKQFQLMNAKRIAIETKGGQDG